MPPLPDKAPEAVRESIIIALETTGQRFLDRNGPTERWLNHWGLKEQAIYDELIVGLKASDRLFLKEPEPGKLQAYQCILDWPEDGDDYPAIVVHVTLAPKGDPPSVRVALHPSDTVHTLPALPYPDDTHENDQDPE